MEGGEQEKRQREKGEGRHVGGKVWEIGREMEDERKRHVWRLVVTGAGQG